MANVINWFEIPAQDVDRACGFYSALIGARFQRDPQMPDNAFFEHGDSSVGGEVCRADYLNPGSGGVLIYLNAPEGVAEALSRVEAAGGKIVMPRRAIGPHGYIAVVRDTEGNTIGLHNMES